MILLSSWELRSYRSLPTQVGSFLLELMTFAPSTVIVTTAALVSKSIPMEGMSKIYAVVQAATWGRNARGTVQRRV